MDGEEESGAGVDADGGEQVGRLGIGRWKDGKEQNSDDSNDETVVGYRHFSSRGVACCSRFGCCEIDECLSVEVDAVKNELAGIQTTYEGNRWST